MRIINLSQERNKRRPPSCPPPSDVRQAAEMVRSYVKALMEWSEREHGVIDIACGDLCCFADCLDRVADTLEAKK